MAHPDGYRYAMSRRLIAVWAVAVFIIVGAILIFIGVTTGEDTSYGDKPGSQPVHTDVAGSVLPG